jgi:hypothetical protein
LLKIRSSKAVFVLIEWAVGPPTCWRSTENHLSRVRVEDPTFPDAVSPAAIRIVVVTPVDFHSVFERIVSDTARQAEPFELHEYMIGFGRVHVRNNCARWFNTSLTDRL